MTDDVRRYGQMGLGRDLMAGGGTYNENAYAFVIHTDVVKRQIADVSDDTFELIANSLVKDFSESVRSVLNDLRFSGQVGKDIDSL